MLNPIPESVTREEFLDAAQSLFEMLNVTAGEVGPFVILGPDFIDMHVVARTEGDESSFPVGIIPAAPRQEFAELSHHAFVRIV